MTPALTIEKQPDGRYRVTVSERGEQTTHLVTLQLDYYEKLTAGKMPPEELIRRSFEFLLARESKESILETFDLTVISRYFPEYERAMARLLKR